MFNDKVRGNVDYSCRFKEPTERAGAPPGFRMFSVDGGVSSRATPSQVMVYIDTDADAYSSDK